jgi:uncharacterized phage protein (TIGR01671 family)
MSREIKFRGRRIDNSQWVYGQYFVAPLTDENSGTTLDAGWYFLSGETRHCIVQDGVSFVIDEKTLGQYTGLKDMKDVEIYEGDILQLYGDFDDGFAPYHKATVTFHEGCFCIDDPLEYGGYVVPVSRWVDDHSGEMNEIEVIGNIYENADLLNATP